MGRPACLGLLAFTFLYRFGAGLLGEVLLLKAQDAIGSMVELGLGLFPGLKG